VDVAPAEVRLVVYRCVDGHVTRARFFAEADEINERWECSTCGGIAVTDLPGVLPPRKPSKPVAQNKTPWQHLRERRTIEELESLLEERLASLRGIDGASA
jgi:hypothetical protein